MMLRTYAIPTENHKNFAKVCLCVTCERTKRLLVQASTIYMLIHSHHSG